jgi:hypothetical protein
MPGYDVQWHLQQPKQKYVEVQSKHESMSSFPKISSGKLTTFNSISQSITTPNVETAGKALNTQVLPVSHSLTGEVINQKKYLSGESSQKMQAYLMSSRKNQNEK